jgi:hypothetical protein
MNIKLNRFQYDITAPDEGGGGTLPMSLTELDNLSDTPPAIQSGDGTPKPPDISQIPPVVDTPPAVVKDVNADGTLQDGYEKDADGKVTKIPDTPATDDPNPDYELDTEDFFAQVEQITGEPVQVEYGDTDPLSPEGVAIREKAVREDATKKFEDYLKTSDPRAYAYFLHRESGGSDDDFFAERTFVLPDENTFNGSIDLQTNVLKQDLIDKGVPADVADATIAKYIKDNVLTEKATVAYNSKKQAQANQMKALEEAQRDEQAQFQAAVNGITTTIGKNITEGNLNFIIADAKKAQFNEFIKQNLRFDNGKFYVVNEIGENLKEVLESQYFQFVKGDLKALVQKEAKTQTVQRLKATVKKAASTGLKTADTPNPNKGYIPLGEL